MHTVTIARGSMGDWNGVYIDGRLSFEFAESVDVETVLREVAQLGPFTVQKVECNMEDIGNLPYHLDNLTPWLLED